MYNLINGIFKVNEQRTEKMIEAKKKEGTIALKEVSRLFKEFGFTAGVLKGSIAEGWKK